MNRDLMSAADELAEAVHMLVQASALHRVATPENATRTAVMVHGCEAVCLKKYAAFMEIRNRA